jgi:hypothetical protein
MPSSFSTANASDTKGMENRKQQRRPQIFSSLASGSYS